MVKVRTRVRTYPAKSGDVRAGMVLDQLSRFVRFGSVALVVLLKMFTVHRLKVNATKVWPHPKVSAFVVVINNAIRAITWRDCLLPHLTRSAIALFVAKPTSRTMRVMQALTASVPKR